MNILKSKISTVQDVAAKRAIKQFASKFKFVYFGKINQHESDQWVVRGVTLSVSHKDDYCAMGSFRGRDVVVVERQNTLNFLPGQSKNYKWQIMQIDLKSKGLPHVFLDANHHEKSFYYDFFAKYSKHENLYGSFLQDDPQFLKYFKILANQSDINKVRSMISPEITAMLAHHFKQFDYEIDDDTLIIYATNMSITVKNLQEMLRVGVWLADELDKKRSYQK
ncbi:MAG: hypothetical protein PVI21_03525 [Candidatus Woesebacteria bacterium]|jgi:hypothetical protein